MKLDDTDRKIIGMLKEDARAGNTSIARALGITEGAVRWRIKRLVGSGAIRRFTIDTSAEAGTFAVLMVKARGETKKMMGAISGLGIQKDAYEISGEFDGCIVIEGSSVEEIDRKVDQVRKLKEVADTRTFVSFRRW
ncbi:MAG: Lrp/AsnC family transcriptional regulator [Candidatus Micrarchaeota archaeon]